MDEPDYHISAPHIYQLEYCEGSRRLLFECDLRDYWVAVYANQFLEWEPPHASEIVTDEDRARIVQRICDYLSAGGNQFEVLR
jgi:hypothetical protein